MVAKAMGCTRAPTTIVRLAGLHQAGRACARRSACHARQATPSLDTT